MAYSKQKFPFPRRIPTLLVQPFALHHSLRFPIVKLLSIQLPLTGRLVGLSDNPGKEAQVIPNRGAFQPGNI